MSITIIAEIGVNHNGEEALAYKLIDAAVNAGVDAVKFQTYKSDKLVTKNAKKADYQRRDNSQQSQFEMLENLELSFESFYRIKSYCDDLGVEFISTAFDNESLNFLVQDLNLNVLKISSSDITNAPLLLEYARTGANLILSTGMSSLGEVESALSVLAYGLINSNDKQSRESFYAAYCSHAAQTRLKEKVTLLHCTSDYPALYDDINLSAMRTLREAFGLKCGYSDHSIGSLVPVIASSLGACIIEKHFTLDKSLPGPDHAASIEPDEMKDMVDQIRAVSLILGDGIKSPRGPEIDNRSISRRSLVASSEINKNDMFSNENIILKRPGTGRSPMEYWDILGSISQKHYNEDDLI